MRFANLLPLVCMLLAGPAAAQIGLPGGNLPQPGGVLDPLGDRLDQLDDRVLNDDLEQTTDQADEHGDDVAQTAGQVDGQVSQTTDEVGELGGDIAQTAERLLRERQQQLAAFLSRNAEFVEPDARGDPARRGVLLVMDLEPSSIARLEAEGFSVIGEENIDGLGLMVTRIATPGRLSLAQAEGVLQGLLPGATISPDNIHFQSGIAPLLPAMAAASSGATTSVPVGMIDGAPANGDGNIEVRGFAEGAPRPSNHGTTIAYLLSRAGVRSIGAADIYGADPAGGNALAIARALGWLVSSGNRVVTISLVGPRNAVVERAIAAAQRNRVAVVAPVGNDGPAAPPAYPASYPEVVAVTGVDGRNRVLIEAGRAVDVDFAAPGADLVGQDRQGRRLEVRGTSFASPLVAARVAHAMEQDRNWHRILVREAEDLGQRGRDKVFGHGLVCGDCRGR